MMSARFLEESRAWRSFVCGAGSWADGCCGRSG